jgi:hypothetical protein
VDYEVEVRDFSSTGSRVVGVALRSFVAAFVVACVALAASLGLAAPQFNTTITPAPVLPIDQLERSHVPDDQSYVPRELQARQLKRLREEHQKQVFSDAARLVQLATALKQQVQNGDKVTQDALKDVDEIGKLAKRVSDRIKTQ